MAIGVFYIFLYLLFFFAERKNKLLEKILGNNKKKFVNKKRRNIGNKFERWFLSLNLRIDLNDFLLINFITSTFIFLICNIVKLSIVLNIFVLALIFSFIFVFLNLNKNRKISQKEEQLEYFLVSLSGNLYTNPNIINCIKKSIDRIDEPLKGDFVEVIDNYSKGLVFKEALKIMIEKNDSRLITNILSGFIAAYEKGTDLEYFIKYQIEYIREKKSLKSYINILSSGPKYSSYFIISIPIISIFIITIINKDFINYYIQGFGIFISFYAFSSFICGFLIINKIITNLGKNILIS